MSGRAAAPTGGAAPRGYRWTCPRCGESRVKLVVPGKNAAHVRNDLRSHLRMRAGDGHGPGAAMPPGVDPDALDEHVEPVGGEAWA